MTNFPAMPTAHLFYIPSWYDSDPSLRLETAMAISDHVGSDHDKAYPLKSVFLHCDDPSARFILYPKRIRTTIVGNQPDLEKLVQSIRARLDLAHSFVYVADNHWCQKKTTLSERFAQELKPLRIVTYSSIPDELG